MKLFAETLMYKLNIFLKLFNLDFESQGTKSSAPCEFKLSVSGEER